MKKILSVLLTVCMLFSMVPAVMAETAAADSLTLKTNFPLSEANGANSEYFMHYEASEYVNQNYTNYIFGLDYNTWLPGTTDLTGVFATDYGNRANGSGAGRFLVYSKDLGTPVTDVLNLTTKDNKLFWTIDNVDYQINPEEKMIQVYTRDTSKVTDAALKARFETLNGATLTVPKGNYATVGFLATTTSSNRTLTVTLNYTDGTTGSGTCTVVPGSNIVNSKQAEGSIMTQFTGSHGVGSGGRQFKPYTVAANPAKELESVTVKSSSSYNPILIISAWGNSESITDVLAELADVTAVDAANYATVKATLAKADEILTSNGVASTDLGTDNKGIYDAAVSALEAYEASLRGTNDALTLRTDFEVTEANGANAKYFLDYTTNKNLTTPVSPSESFPYVKGLDYNGLVNVTSNISKPTGATTDTYTSTNAGLISYKVDQSAGSDQYAGYVNFVTKNNNKYWTINDVDYLVKPEEKALKIYSGIDASGVTDTELKARFESMKNPTFDVVNGYYDEITVLAGVTNGSATLYATVIYEGGTESEQQTISISTPSAPSPWTGQTAGYTYIQALNLGNSNRNGYGITKFSPYVLNAFDTAKKVDKIMFSTNSGGTPVFVISAFGETASIAEILNSEDKSAEVKISLVDAILAANNITIDDLSDEIKAKYLEADNQVGTAGLEYFETNNVSITEGANSKLFMDYGDSGASVDYSEGLETTAYNYFAGYINTIPYDNTKKQPKVAVYSTHEGDTVEYNGTTYDAVKTWGHYPVAYSKTKSGGSWKGYIPLDANNNWKITYDDEIRNWHIDVDNNDKAIKLQKYSAPYVSQLTDGDLANVAVAETATINVDDGYYDNFYFLAANITGQSATVNAEVIYTDGTKENRTFSPRLVQTDDNHSTANGYVTFTYGRQFLKSNLAVIPVKKVDKINLSLGTTDREIIIISAQADTATVRSMINYLPEEITGENYNVMSEARAEINSLIEELNIDISKDAALNSKYNDFLEKMQEAEKNIIVNKITYKQDVININVSNHTGEEKTFELIAAVYSPDETKLLQTHTAKKTVAVDADCVDLTESFKVTAEGEYKLKIMAWDSFGTLLPLTDVYDDENKVYMFVGDSITHADVYPSLVESYYISRFPTSYATFENAGRSGGSAAGALKRYDYDIANRNADEAIIMFGMNDVGRDAWPLGPSDDGYAAQLESNLWRINNCINNITDLAQKLINADTVVALMTPSIYDTREYSSTTNYKGVNSGLTEIANREKTLAPELGAGIINLHDHMNTINNTVLTSVKQEMINDDRVHPNAYGAYVIAYNVINHWFEDSGLVAQVTIDAANATAEAENATVKEVKVENGEVTYYYTPKALPWYYGYNYQQAETYVDLTNDLNREIIKVTGLESDTTYTIKFNGEVVTTATGAQLLAGVNIATLATNPGQIAAKAVYDNIEHKKTKVVALRDHYKSYFDGKITALDQTLIDTNNASIESSVDAAREAAQPKRYTVTITK